MIDRYLDTKKKRPLDIEEVSKMYLHVKNNLTQFFM